MKKKKESCVADETIRTPLIVKVSYLCIIVNKVTNKYIFPRILNGDLVRPPAGGSWSRPGHGRVGINQLALD